MKRFSWHKSAISYRIRRKKLTPKYLQSSKSLKAHLIAHAAIDSIDGFIAIIRNTPPNNVQLINPVKVYRYIQWTEVRSLHLARLQTRKEQAGDTYATLLGCLDRKVVLKLFGDIFRSITMDLSAFLGQRFAFGGVIFARQINRLYLLATFKIRTAR